MFNPGEVVSRCPWSLLTPVLSWRGVCAGRDGRRWHPIHLVYAASGIPRVLGLASRVRRCVVGLHVAMAGICLSLLDSIQIIMDFTRFRLITLWILIVAVALCGHGALHAVGCFHCCVVVAVPHLWPRSTRC